MEEKVGEDPDTTRECVYRTYSWERGYGEKIHAKEEKSCAFFAVPLKH
jgi:hypothetical protein